MAPAKSGTGFFLPRTHSSTAAAASASNKSSPRSYFGIFSPRPAQQAAADGALSPFVIALQQQLQVQQLQKAYRQMAKRSPSIGSDSGLDSMSSISGGSLTASSTFSGVECFLSTPCHSSSVNVLSPSQAAPGYLTPTAPQYQAPVLPSPQLSYESLALPVAGALNSFELQLALQQQQLEIEAHLQQLLVLQQQLSPAPRALTPVAPVSPVMCQQQLAVASPALSIARQPLAPAPAVGMQQQLQHMQLRQQQLQVTEEQLQLQLQAEMLHLLSMV